MWEYCCRGEGTRRRGGNQGCMNGNKYCPSSNVPSVMSMMIHVYEQKGLETKKIEENCAKRNAVGNCGFSRG
jgi:hypothetical protein